MLTFFDRSWQNHIGINLYYYLLWLIFFNCGVVDITILNEPIVNINTKENV